MARTSERATALIAIEITTFFLAIGHPPCTSADRSREIDGYCRALDLYRIDFAKVVRALVTTAAYLR